MSFPVGVVTRVVRVPTILGFDGEPAVGTVGVSSSSALVWDATEETILRVNARARLVAGTATLTLPVTDQAGFSDGAGGAVTDWAYTLAVSLQSAEEPPAVTFLLPAAPGEHVIDFDVSALTGGTVVTTSDYLGSVAAAEAAAAAAAASAAEAAATLEDVLAAAGVQLGKVRDLYRPIEFDFDTSMLTGAGITMTTGLPGGFSLVGASAPRWDQTQVRWLSGQPIEANPGVPADGAITRTTGATNNQCTMPSFIFTGQHMMLSINSYGVQAVTVYIDGKRAFRGYTGAPPSAYFISIPFAVYSTHQIEIHTGVAVVLNFWLHIGETIEPGPERFTIGGDGDSYADIGQAPDYGGLALAIFERTGFAVVVFAQGSTGWLAQNDAINLTKSPYNGATRIAAKLLHALDMILVIGSVNDSEDPPGIATEVALYAAHMAPTPVVVAGVERLDGGSTGYDNNNNAIIATAEAVKDAGLNVLGTVDWYNLGWQTGTGSTAGVVGDGNQDFIIGADTIHPNRVGAEHFAAHFMAAIGEMGQVAVYDGSIEAAQAAAEVAEAAATTAAAAAAVVMAAHLFPSHTPSNGGTYAMTGTEYGIAIDSPVASFTVVLPPNPAQGQVARVMFYDAIPALNLNSDADVISPDLTAAPAGVSSYAWKFDTIGGVDTWVGITNP